MDLGFVSDGGDREGDDDLDIGGAAADMGKIMGTSSERYSLVKIEKRMELSTELGGKASDDAPGRGLLLLEGKGGDVMADNHGEVLNLGSGLASDMLAPFDGCLAVEHGESAADDDMVPTEVDSSVMYDRGDTGMESFVVQMTCSTKYCSQASVQTSVFSQEWGSLIECGSMSMVVSSYRLLGTRLSGEGEGVVEMYPGGDSAGREGSAYTCL